MTDSDENSSKIVRKEQLYTDLGFPQREPEDAQNQEDVVEVHSECADGDDEQSAPVEPPPVVVKADKAEDKGDEFNPISEFAVNDAFRSQQVPSEVTSLIGGMIAPGEITLLIAATGLGKTIATLGLLEDDIKAGRVKPQYVVYVNKDDSGLGIQEKVQFANELGFKVIADRPDNVFSKVDLINLTRHLAKSGKAKDSFIILDTFKKFHDVNDKKETVNFYRALRPFTISGGTILGIGHTNKATDQNGRAVYAGVADIIQDVDAALIGELVLSPTEQNAIQAVEFRREKGRLVKTPSVICGYAGRDGLSWRDRVRTVHVLTKDEMEVHRLKNARLGDLEAIICISEILRIDGSMKKMELVKAVMETTGESRRDVMATLDRYTGDDPKRHLWNFKVGDRGAKSYKLL